MISRDKYLNQLIKAKNNGFPKVITGVRRCGKSYLLTEIYKNDYIALVQSCIDIKSEYRVIYLNKKLMFAYKKNNENATFTGNISPLHFEGAYAKIVENKNLLNAFDEFVQQLNKVFIFDFLMK